MTIPDDIGLKIDLYFSLATVIHDHFGYQEDWRVIPMDDMRHAWWRLDAEEGYGGEVHYALKGPETFADDDEDDLYQVEIYTQRFLPKWVYRADRYTMISVDTNTDGNKFLMIFDNAKEVKAAE